MKRIFMFVLAAVFVTIPYCCPAADISLQQQVYISSVRWYAGAAQSANKISALHPGDTYGTVTALVEVAKNTAAAPVNGTMLIGEVLDESGNVTDRVFRSARLEDKTIHELTFQRVQPKTVRDKLRIYLWDGVAEMRPMAQVQELGTTAEQVDETAHDMQIIRERIAKDFNLYSTSANPQSVLDKLGSDGRFNDIDYSIHSQTNWNVSSALTNVTTMLKAYYSEGNRWYHNSELFEKCEAVLRDWAQHKDEYYSSNWWYQSIDVPKKMSTILLYPLPEDADYLPALRAVAKKGMPTVDESKPHKTASSQGTGGNLIDELQTSVKIAVATDDADSMKNIVQYLLDNELSVFSHGDGGEGIMIDGMFHQHGDLLYNGSYGSVFCGGVNMILGYLADTQFMVSERALNAYADFILDGHSWLFRGNGSDFACFGRAISRRGGVGESVRRDSLGAANVLLTVPGLERRQELLALKNSRLSGTDAGFDGAKHFWTSDFTAVHRNDFYVGIRNSSNRNQYAEYMNGENSKGYYIADGATVIMKTGREYYNIFPCWDWSKIPGTTTAYHSFETIPATNNKAKGAKEFVGGVSNGLYAVTAMDYSHNGVAAKKANFVFDKGFTALGAGITGTGSNEVFTTLNQCLLNGNVQYSGDGTNAQTLPKADERTVADVSWVLHDGVGYYFPEKQNAVIGNNAKSGTWQSINSTQNASVETQNIFALSLSHGTAPQNASYAYTVLPVATANTLAAYRQNPDMVAVANTEKCQAVWSKQANSAGIVFWTQGVPNYQQSVTLPAAVTGLDSDLTITAEKDPCIVLLTKKGNQWELCVSNPKNTSLANTIISINRKLSGSGAVTENEKTTVTVELPQGLERGKTTTVLLTEIQ